MPEKTAEVPMSRPETAGANGRAGQPVPGRLSVPRQASPVDRTARLNAELAEELAQERHVAIELQRAILPLHDDPFDLPGLRAVVRYLPASKAGRVGGDWYITAEMPSGLVLVAIGDVAGHGLAALAGLAITGAAPDRLVSWLNDLVRHVAPEHTASVAAGYFDPVTRKLTWAQAGHLPLVLVRGGWATMLDSPEGVLLGAGTGCYSATSAQLDAGDLLLLYSDGLVERRGQSLDDGLAGLAAAAHGSGDPEQTVTAILDALRSAEPEDDTCLVALQIL